MADAVTDILTRNAPRGRFPDLGSEGSGRGAVSFPAVLPPRGQSAAATPPPAFPEVPRAVSPSFPDLPRTPATVAQRLPDVPAAKASEGPSFPELPKAPASEARFPDLPKTPTASGPSFPELPKTPQGEARFPEVGLPAGGGTESARFPEAGPQTGLTTGMGELLGSIQGIGLSLSQAVQALQAIHRMGSSSRTPGLQQVGGSPSFVWDESVEGYPAASPSVNATSRAGLRGAGGYGFGSGGHDPVNFLEPNKRRPGV